MASKKPVLFSGIQPSGQLMIGNYIGAIKHWVSLQDQYDCLFCLVDLHTITVKQDPKQLREHCYDVLALYIACGLNPEKNVVFMQSHVPEHAQLAWVLNCFASMGELNRMTQFKDKSQRYASNINAGLFTYPVLMAADILLYNTQLVPVGHDQKQHLELTRDIAIRFNKQYGEIFTVPEAFIPKVGGRIMSLQAPDKKMSKSDSNAQNYIALLDEPAVIMKKFKRAVTDSDSEVRYDPENKAGVSNLLTLMSAVTDQPIDALEKQFEGKGYGDFKTVVGESIVDFLAPIQTRFHALRKDKVMMNAILEKGTRQAKTRASLMIEKVYVAMGFIV